MCVGLGADFEAAASGSPAPDVQWQVDSGSGFGNINSGGTSVHLLFIVAAGDNGKHYHAVFKNGVGSVTSNSAKLTAISQLGITTSPTDQTVNAGQTVTLTAASDYPTADVQWYRSTNGGGSFSPISGATSTTLSFTAASTNNGNKYYAQFSSNCGSKNSNTATITVNFAPSISTNPTAQAICENTSVTFNAAANGNPSPTVQWQSNASGSFANIGGATSTSYSFTVHTTDNGHQFQAIFTNSQGNATTTAATLTVNTAPVAGSSPSDQAVTVGQQASFTAGASSGGSPAPTVKWQVKVGSGGFTDIPGATSLTYTFTPTLADNGNQYRAVFLNSCTSGTPTLAAKLTVNAVGPIITTNPTSQTICENTSVTFTGGGKRQPHSDGAVAGQLRREFR